MRKNIKWIFCIISFIVFMLLACLVKLNDSLKIDTVIYNLMANIISDNMTILVKFITFLGSATIVILITIFLLVLLKNKKTGLFSGLNLIIITIFQYILKYLIGRPRPVGINLIEEKNYSFPSGHSLTVMAFYGFIIYLIYKSNLKHKKIYITLLVILILLIGLSRVYLGVHYITDVLGGFTFSLFYLIIYISIIKKYLEENNKK